jgi:hypothetical protein
MRLILGLPTSTPLGKRLMLAYLTGRKSGRHYRQPISYVRDGGTLLTPGGGRWKLNLVEGQSKNMARAAAQILRHASALGIGSRLLVLGGVDRGRPVAGVYLAGVMLSMARAGQHARDVPVRGQHHHKRTEPSPCHSPPKSQELKGSRRVLLPGCWRADSGETAPAPARSAAVAAELGLRTIWHRSDSL